MTISPTSAFVGESMCVPGENNTALIAIKRPMPCVVIFVHGVNSEGEWYSRAELGLVAGLNDRLGRNDFIANDYRISDRSRILLTLQNSPVIRFYWGYRAPEKETDFGSFPYKIPLKTRDGYAAPGGCTSYTYSPYSFELTGASI